jgi:hypothetical protein
MGGCRAAGESSVPAGILQIACGMISLKSKTRQNKLARVLRDEERRASPF